MKNLPNKDDDPPILVFVHGVGDRGKCIVYVIAGGIQMKVNSKHKGCLHTPCHIPDMCFVTTPPPPQICRDSHLFEFHQIIWWHEEMHLITYFVLLSLSWISIPSQRRRFLLHTFVINTRSSIQQYKTLKYNTLVSRFFLKMSVLFQISPFFKIETFLL